MLLDKVFGHLELVEKDYFGLQFVDLSPAPDGMVSHAHHPVGPYAMVSHDWSPSAELYLYLISGRGRGRELICSSTRK